MKKKVYRKKVVGFFMLPLFITSMAGLAEAVITPGAGESVTLTGRNTEPIEAVGGNVTVTLAEDAVLDVNGTSDSAVALQPDSTVTLNDGSSITITNNVPSYGVNIYNVDGDAAVSLDNASISALVEADGGEFAAALGIGIMGGNSTVSLDNGSSVSASADGEFYAIAYGIDSEGESATVSLDNGSSVSASADGEFYAIAYGIRAEGESATVSLDNGSSVSASADGSELAVALGIEAEGGDATISLDNGSSVSASASARNTGGAYSYSGGVYLYGDTSATISLDGSTVAASSRSASDSAGETVAGISAGIIASSEGESTVSLDNHSTVSALTSLESEVADGGEAVAAGIVSDPGDTAAITLNHGSSVIATINNNTNFQADGGEGVEKRAIGIYSFGDATINLNNGSSVTAKATGDYTYAAGILQDDTDSTVNITLSNGSSVAASASGDYSYAAGIYVQTGNVTVNIDSSSSVSGSDYAIYTVPLGGSTTVDNRGLIAGRLGVSELNNSASGILQAELTVESGQMIDGINDDGSYYNNVVNRASLAGGSTVAIATNDPVERTIYEGDPDHEDTVTDFGLGLTAPGETVLETGNGRVAASVKYRILSAGTGDWNRSQLALRHAGDIISPMLDLSWSDESDANHLVMEARFLTPAQAGLSANGEAAFWAAMEDGIFNFNYGSPEDWTPDVSGANMFGKRRFVNSSRRNVETRLASLGTGVNAGDGMATDGFWVDFRYTDAEKDEDNGIEGFDSDTSSLTLGYDHQINNLTVGGAVSAGESDIALDISSEELNIDHYLLTLYGGYDWDAWFMDGQLSYGWGDVEGKRVVTGSSLQSDYDSDVYFARLAGGRNFTKNNWVISPQVAMDYTSIGFDSYTESGALPLALSVESQDYEICNVGGGLSLENTWRINGNLLLTPDVSAMVYYDLIGDEIETTSTFVGGSTAFVTRGADAERTTVDLAAGLTLGSMDSPMTFKLGYEYISRDDFESHNVNGRFRFLF